MTNESSKPRILIVDDNEDNTRLLRSAFQEAGFEAMIAFDGVEGLDLATKHLPDIIITGIVMPRMSGFEMMKNLSNNVATSKIPVLVYSHLGREEDRVEAQKLGARDFLIQGMITPHGIIERAHKVMSKGKSFYIEFDPQKGDAKELAEAFNFKPYFECPDGSRMLLELEPAEGVGTGNDQEFRARFTCQKKEQPQA